ncbi:hypothetical protein QWI33_25130 [Glycomyces tritici]|uniref:hydroxymethylbilane synthase n=1 Tax=Glycomyces tritici TaxID=2665176 RepID=A0ABT7YWN1_9ACTN|nr:hypothetical protein [Glycomyces tritici]MDN3243029.1 hypothetical protein [Glycomyces tritici]
MSDKTSRLASRESLMALAQVERVQTLLEHYHPGITVEAVTTTTEGDRWTGALADRGGKALFCKEVDQLIVAGRADVAVHCLKDVPGDVGLPAGTMFAAFLERDSPADCLVHPGGLTFAQLPAGARVGTSSPRRAAPRSCAGSAMTSTIRPSAATPGHASRVAAWRRRRAHHGRSRTRPRRTDRRGNRHVQH